MSDLRNYNSFRDELKLSQHKEANDKPLIAQKTSTSTTTTAPANNHSDNESFELEIDAISNQISDRTSNKPQPTSKSTLFNKMSPACRNSAHRDIDNDDDSSGDELEESVNDKLAKMKMKLSNKRTSENPSQERQSTSSAKLSIDSLFDNKPAAVGGSIQSTTTPPSSSEQNEVSDKRASVKEKISNIQQRLSSLFSKKLPQSKS